MSKLRILYISSEIEPFMNRLGVGEYVRDLPEAMQNEGAEIRVLVPRFGVIHERKNRLHEVVRLSGINIPVGDEERPLVIKVASVPQAKMQVYFIDNEDLFSKKKIYADKEGNIFEDNDERAIFFCKGIIETVRKLGWSPDIVHCHDWVSGLVPLLIKTAFKNDPLFKESKVVFTGHAENLEQTFDKDTLADKILMDYMDESMLEVLKNNPTPQGFSQIGAKFADVATSSTKDTSVLESLRNIVGDSLETIERAEGYETRYYEIYKELVPEVEPA
ncbi:MAG: glycogen/starch synthase [Bernardetiaceae bacterium]|nr:glycogen/starch synthase [Bernardetiaceae bacterium]